MKFASKVARVLGPRGLMPNPKLGTVTEDVEAIMQRLNSGVPFKADKEVPLKFRNVVGIAWRGLRRGRGYLR